MMATKLQLTTIQALQGHIWSNKNKLQTTMLAH